MEPQLVADARRRLDALDPELVTDDLRAAILNAAKAAHRRAGFNAARTRIAASCIELAADDDWPAAARARADLDALDRLADELPPVTVPEDVGMAAVEHADRLLRNRAAGITVRTPAFVIEDGTWRQMPSGWRSDIERPRPASLASDRRAVALVAQVKATGSVIASSLDAVTGTLRAPGQVDVLALLETCSAVAEQISTLAKRAAEVDAEVTKADVNRSSNGATWTPPAAWLPTVIVPARTALV